MLLESRRLGLSLSGGGYRAAAFHLGTLKKLEELGLLSKVDVLSTISGGSITGAAWCLNQGDYESFHRNMYTSLNVKSVIRSILTSFTFFKTLFFILLFLAPSIYLLFTTFAPFSLPLLTTLFLLVFKFQFYIFPVSKEVEKAYNKFFYGGRTLSDLHDKPLLAIGSSNLQTGRPFTFSKLKMSDSTYAYSQPPIHFLHKKFPIARAVTASSCVPFAFTPINIAKYFFVNKEDFTTIRPQLVDGGVYDNQGIQKLTQWGSSYECGIIITSDAGGGFISDKNYNNTVALLIRTVDMFMHRIKTAQMTENIYRNVKSSGKPIAYFSLGWRLGNCIPGFIHNMIQGKVLPEVIDAHGFNAEWVNDPGRFQTEIQNHLESRVDYASIKFRDLEEEQWQMARLTGTNLTSLSTHQLDYLIRHAENLTELQVKLYCPFLIHRHGLD